MKNLLWESANGVDFMSPDDMETDYSDDLNRIERESGINILSDKELTLLAVMDGKVVGALYTSTGPNDYSFDIIVDKPYRGKGIGKQLTDLGLSDYNQVGDELGVPLKLDVVNPKMIPYLKLKGLKVVQQHDGHTIMTK